MTDEIDNAFEEWFNSKSDGEQVNFLFCGNKAKECFRAGTEFGIKNSKEYLLIRCKKLCTSLDNLQNEAKEWRDERKEWQKKVEELKKGIPELRTKIMKKCYEPRDLVTVDKEQNERRKCYNAGIKFSSHDFEEFMNRLIDRIMGKKRGY